MAQCDRVDSNQNFLHQQAQDLLSYCDIEHVCAYSQFAAKTRDALRQLQVLSFVHCCHLQRL